MNTKTKAVVAAAALAIINVSLSMWVLHIAGLPWVKAAQGLIILMGLRDLHNWLAIKVGLRSRKAPK
jgi:hypothetical protein